MSEPRINEPPTIYDLSNIYATAGGGGGGGGEITYIEIGGIKYPTKQIGNRIWFLENLALEWTGLTVVNGTGYNNNTPTAYKYNIGWSCKYGYFYNYYAVNDLITNHSNLLDGWRVPLVADFNDLINTAGGISVCQTKLCSKLWPAPASDDSLGFNMCPGGYFANGNLQNGSAEERFQIDSGTSTDTKIFDINTNIANVGTVYGDWKFSAHIRLCKDV